MRDTMTLSDDGLDLIKRFESFRPRPYLCPAGVPTIGYGCTIYEDGTAVSLDDGPITEAEADEMLRRLLGRYEAAVQRYAQVDLEQGQFDALVSFAYNVGNEALRGSTLLRLLNGGDVAGS
jgi:lysozyme